MKRFLTVALLATALSSPAFAESNTSAGSASVNSGSSSQGSTGISAGGVNTGISGTARVGADVGVGAGSSADPAGASYDNNTSDNSLSGNTSADTSANSPANLSGTAMNNDSNVTGSATGNVTNVAPGKTASGGASGGGQTAAAGEINAESLNRNDIILIQQALRQEGVYNGTADGVWGPRTENALMQFQEQNRLSSTDGLNTDTLQQLGVQLGGSAGASSSTSIR